MDKNKSFCSNYENFGNRELTITTVFLRYMSLRHLPAVDGARLRREIDADFNDLLS